MLGLSSCLRCELSLLKFFADEVGRTFTLITELVANLELSALTALGSAKGTNKQLVDFADLPGKNENLDCLTALLRKQLIVEQELESQVILAYTVTCDDLLATDGELSLSLIPLNIYFEHPHYWLPLRLYIKKRHNLKVKLAGWLKLIEQSYFTSKHAASFAKIHLLKRELYAADGSFCFLEWMFFIATVRSTTIINYMYALLLQ